jgi:dTDP-4-dehydrorhamnose 3,5-epimerase
LIFTPTPLADVYLIDIERREDERGFFARTWCADELCGQGLQAQLAQCSVSFNRRKGTLRGMHYQRSPHEETKVVTCLRGSVYDVVVDLRPDSATRLKWFAAELSSTTLRMLYIPAGCAHGFQTLEDDCLLNYQISAFYQPESSAGVRWNDPAFQIEWPLPVSSMSERDASYELYQMQAEPSVGTT